MKTFLMLDESRAVVAAGFPQNLGEFAYFQVPGQTAPLLLSRVDAIRISHEIVFVVASPTVEDLITFLNRHENTRRYAYKELNDLTDRIVARRGY